MLLLSGLILHVVAVACAFVAGARYHEHGYYRQKFEIHLRRRCASEVLRFSWMALASFVLGAVCMLGAAR